MKAVLAVGRHRRDEALDFASSISGRQRGGLPRSRGVHMVMPRVDFDPRSGRPSQIEREVLDLIELWPAARQRPGYDRPIRVEPETRQGFFDHRRCHAFAMRFGVEIELRTCVVRVRREPDRQTQRERAERRFRQKQIPAPARAAGSRDRSRGTATRGAQEPFRGCSAARAWPPSGSTKNLSSGPAPRVSENSKGVWSSPIGEGQVGLRPATVSPPGRHHTSNERHDRGASEPNSSAVHSRTSFAEQSSDNVETAGLLCVEILHVNLTRSWCESGHRGLGTASSNPKPRHGGSLAFANDGLYRSTDRVSLPLGYLTSKFSQGFSP